MNTINKFSIIFLVLILHFQYLKHTSASRIHSRALNYGISPKIDIIKIMKSIFEQKSPRRNTERKPETRQAPALNPPNCACGQDGDHRVIVQFYKEDPEIYLFNRYDGWAPKAPKLKALVCLGGLISEKHVLTHADCWHRPYYHFYDENVWAGEVTVDMIRAVVGAEKNYPLPHIIYVPNGGPNAYKFEAKDNKKYVEIERIKTMQVHDDRGDDPGRHQFAIVTLKEKTTGISPLCLPHTPSQGYKDGTLATLFAFGTGLAEYNSRLENDDNKMIQWPLQKKEFGIFGPKHCETWKPDICYECGNVREAELWFKK